MPAACRQVFCNAAPRLTVAELFDRGLRRSRLAPRGIEGERCADSEGNAVVFSLDISDGRITAVGFRAAVCATLIAYCEYIAETVIGLEVEIARSLTATDLAAAVPGVPALKRERAVLAIAGFRAALHAAARGEHCNEGRLYLRHSAP